MENSDRIKIITYGCKVNQYESAVIQSNLSGNFGSPERLVIIMSCCVTRKAEKECRQTIKKFLNQKKPPKIIVSSCYVRKDRELLSRDFPEVIFCSDYNEIKDILKIFHWRNRLESFFDRHRAFVKIQDGCNQFCSYCIVPYVRPGNKSRSLNEIEEEIFRLIDKGYSEIVLTGVRLGKYEFYLSGQKSDLTDLLNYLLETVEKNNLRKKVRFRLSSLEITEINPRLLEIFQKNSFNLCPHFHLPLQAGSNRILRLMNRPYTREFYYETVKQIREKIPEVAITTDIIVGFPGESESDFRETKKFIEEVEFSRLHVFPYSIRPGTKAEKISGHIPLPVIQQRRDELLLLDKALRKKFVSRFCNQILPAVFDGENTVLTDNYIHLTVAQNLSPANRIFPVKIISSSAGLLV